jgi:hypothetical protein
MTAWKQKIDYSWFQTFIYSAVMYGELTKAVRQDVSGVSSAASALHPQTQPFWQDTVLPPGVLLMLCWQHRCQAGGWPMAQGGAAILIRG